MNVEEETIPQDMSTNNAGKQIVFAPPSVKGLDGAVLNGTTLVVFPTTLVDCKKDKPLSSSMMRFNPSPTTLTETSQGLRCQPRPTSSPVGHWRLKKAYRSLGRHMKYRIGLYRTKTHSPVTQLLHMHMDNLDWLTNSLHTNL